MPLIQCQGKAHFGWALLGRFMKWTLNTLNFKEEIIVQLPRLLMAAGASGHVSARLEPCAQEMFCLPGSYLDPCGPGAPRSRSCLCLKQDRDACPLGSPHSLHCGELNCYVALLSGNRDQQDLGSPQSSMGHWWASGPGPWGLNHSWGLRVDEVVT